MNQRNFTLYVFHSNKLIIHSRLNLKIVIADSLESANSSILAARRHFKEVVGKKIRIL